MTSPSPSPATPSSNPFTGLLPDRARQIVYVGFALLVLALGGVQLGYSTAEVPVPTWLTVTQTVTLYLGAGLGLTAASNITPSVGRHARQ